MDEKPVKRVVF